MLRNLRIQRPGLLKKAAPAGAVCIDALWNFEIRAQKHGWSATNRKAFWPPRRCGRCCRPCRRWTAPVRVATPISYRAFCLESPLCTLLNPHTSFIYGQKDRLHFNHRVKLTSIYLWGGLAYLVNAKNADKLLRVGCRSPSSIPVYSIRLF